MDRAALVTLFAVVVFVIGPPSFVRGEDALIDAEGNTVSELPPAPSPQAPSVPAGATVIIGLDARNGYDAEAIVATGTDFDDFRAVITGLGAAIAALPSFEAEDLASCKISS